MQTAPGIAAARVADFCISGVGAGYLPGVGTDTSAEITKLHERFQKLSEEFSANLRRIRSSTQTYAAQEGAYIQLDYVEQKLSTSDREFAILQLVLNLAMLVTDKRAIPWAKKAVELQRDYMVKQMTGNVEYVDKTMHLAGDQETSRLLIQARDLFRAASDFASRIEFTLPKAKAP